MLRAINNYLCYADNTPLYPNICNRYHYLNVTIDMLKWKVWVSVDGVQVKTATLQGTYNSTGYFKCGTYMIGTSLPMEIFYKNITIWQYY